MTNTSSIDDAIKQQFVIEQKFSQLEAAEKVRLRAEPEEMYYDEEFTDQFDDEEDKQDMLETLDREGVWVYVAEYKDPSSDEWKIADCLGMVVGIIDSGYAHDLKRQALECLDKAYGNIADDLSERATYACV